MTELQAVLPGSAETWRSTAPPPQVPEALLPPKSGSPGSRLRAWRQRHLLRERRAEEFFADSRRPDLGLPVADRRDVGAFASRLLQSRRFMITALLVLHALAAAAGLVVPRIVRRDLEVRTPRLRPVHKELHTGIRRSEVMRK